MSISLPEVLRIKGEALPVKCFDLPLKLRQKVVMRCGALGRGAATSGPGAPEPGAQADQADGRAPPAPCPPSPAWAPSPPPA